VQRWSIPILLSRAADAISKSLSLSITSPKHDILLCPVIGHNSHSLRSTQYYYQQTHNDVRFAAVIRQKLLF
jgi:hypothetical protein